MRWGLVRQPSIAAEKKGLSEGCDKTMRFRETRFDVFKKVPTDGQPGMFATLDAEMTCSWLGVLKIEIECWLALADIAHLQSYSRDIVWNDKFNLGIIRTLRRYDLVQVIYRGL